MSDNMVFNIRSISDGWIMGELNDGAHKHFFSYSYIRNFPEDVSKALLFLQKEWPQDEHVHVFEAVWEPSIDIWDMSLNENMLSIHIKNYSDFNATTLRKEQVYEFEYTTFLNAFINAMLNVIKSYGLLGYNMSWWHEFPISLFLKLLDISSQKNNINLEEIPAVNNYGSTAIKSSLKAELDIIHLLDFFIED